MNLLYTLVSFVLAIGLLVVVHELGHYLAARRCGVKVLRFSVGFGRTLYSRRVGPDATEWSICAVPLGGYVRMLDEREGDVPPAEVGRAFNRQSLGRRAFIVAAGPAANLLLAVLLYWAVFIGGSRELVPLLGPVQSGSVAAAAGFQAGDRIVSVDGEPTRSWGEVRWSLVRHALQRERVVLGVETETRERSELALDLSRVTIDEGEADVLQQLGFNAVQPQLPPVFGRVLRGEAADRAGVQSGDRVLSLQGAAVDDWNQFVEQVRAAPGKPLQLVIERGQTQQSLTLVPASTEQGGKTIGRIGALPRPDPQLVDQLTIWVSYPPGEALMRAAAQTWESAVISLQMFGRMLIGQVSWKNLSGPVTIADYAGQSAALGLVAYIKFLAAISIGLGVLNLLPIPVLDGGHLLYYLAESIKGRPLSDKVVETGQRIGLAILAMLMAFAFFNDINRLISG